MELLFENLLYDLSPPELAAVLSVMIYERNNATELSNSRFIALQKKMQAIVVNIAQLEKKCGLGEESCMSVDQNVHVGFMEIASNWCKGMTFSQVMQISQTRSEILSCTRSARKSQEQCFVISCILRHYTSPLPLFVQQTLIHTLENSTDAAYAFLHNTIRLPSWTNRSDLHVPAWEEPLVSSLQVEQAALSSPTWHGRQ